MKKAIEQITIIACIAVFCAIVGFADGLSRDNAPRQAMPVKTAVSTSTADNPSKPLKPHEPYIDYVNRIPEDAQPTEVPEDEIIAIARMMYGECRSEWIPIEEKAACAWVVCNRVDSEDPYFPDTIVGVVTQKGGFYGYNKNHPVTQELYDIALDVLTRYYSEYADMPHSSGRVLPSNYLYFTGDGVRNVFRDAYKAPYDTWNWSLESPYEDLQ